MILVRVELHLWADMRLWIWGPRAGSAAGDGRGFSYILAPQSVRAGMTVTSGASAAIQPGNTLPLSAMPLGQQVGVVVTAVHQLFQAALV